MPWAPPAIETQSHKLIGEQPTGQANPSHIDRNSRSTVTSTIRIENATRRRNTQLHGISRQGNHQRRLATRHHERFQDVRDHACGDQQSLNQTETRISRKIGDAQIATFAWRHCGKRCLLTRRTFTRTSFCCRQRVAQKKSTSPFRERCRNQNGKKSAGR